MLDTSTRLVLDAKKGEQGGLIRDVPLSLDPTHRKYDPFEWLPIRCIHC